jgi:hypothetical protein
VFETRLYIVSEVLEGVVISPKSEKRNGNSITKKKDKEMVKQKKKKGKLNLVGAYLSVNDSSRQFVL